MQFYCPRATGLSPYVCNLPSQEYTPNGGFSSTQPSLLRSHPCAHSAVRGGFFAPFLQNCRLTKLVFTACSHTTSPDPINLFFLLSFGNQRIRNASRAANQPFVLSAISIKRRRFVVNSHLQNSSFLSQAPSDRWGTNGGAMAFSLFRRTTIRKTALGRVRFSGACGRIRTGDLLITSELLCQLSHTSIFMRLTLKAKWYLTTNPPSRQLLFLCWAACFVGKYTV